MVVFCFDWELIVAFASNMQPPGEKMLAFEKEPVVLISLNKYMPLRIEKEKKYVRFGNLLTKL